MLKFLKEFAARIEIYFTIYKDAGKFRILIKGLKIATLALAFIIILLFLLKMSQKGNTMDDKALPEKNNSKISVCGDYILDQNEQCELQDSGQACPQETRQCNLMKFGQRDQFGSCMSNCSCVYDEFKYSCVKGMCDAKCS